MSRDRDNASGCLGLAVLIVYGIYLIFSGINSYFHRDERIAEEENIKKAFVNYWKQENIDYFKKFDCSNLNYIPKNLKVDKFYVFSSLKDAKCDINEFNKFQFSYQIDKVKNAEVEKIKDANVLIWIKEIGGEEEGGYEDGSRAIRLNVEINFIEIKTNIIFKKIIKKCIGEPQKEITKKFQTSPTSDYFFGSFPTVEIAKVIENEVKK